MKQRFEEFNLHVKSCVHQASVQHTTVHARLVRDVRVHHSVDIKTETFLFHLTTPPITTISRLIVEISTVFKEAVTTSMELVRDVFPRHGNQDGIPQRQLFTHNNKKDFTTTIQEAPLDMMTHVPKNVRIEVAVPLRVLVACSEDRDDAVVRSSSHIVFVLIYFKIFISPYTAS